MKRFPMAFWLTQGREQFLKFLKEHKRAQKMANEPKKERIKRINIEVGDELHTDIKKRAAERRISITTFVLRAIIEQIKREKSYQV